MLDVTGRGPHYQVTGYDSPPAFVVQHARFGDERYWALVTALADAVLEAGTLSWPRAKAVLKAADPILLRADAAVARWAGAAS